jgi:transcription termination factor NusB
VELAYAFDAGAEAGFLNGVLDRIARERRPSEMA